MAYDLPQSVHETESTHEIETIVPLDSKTERTYSEDNENGAGIEDIVDDFPDGGFRAWSIVAAVNNYPILAVIWP